MNSSGQPSYTILGDGAVTDPAQQFAQEYNTGVFREIYADSTSSTGSSSSYAISKNGNKRLRVTNTGGDLYGSWNLPASENISFADGTVSAPSINFTTNPQTGIYRTTTNGVAITVAGSRTLDIEPALITATVPVTVQSITSGTGTIGTLSVATIAAGGPITCLSVSATGTITASSLVSTGTIRSTAGATVGSLTLPGSYTKHTTGFLGSLTNCTALRFSTLQISAGTDIVYNNLNPTPIVNGDTWTISTNGIYNISCSLSIQPSGGGTNLIITKNATNLTTEDTVTTAQFVGWGGAYTEYQTGVSYTGYFAAGDVIRIHVTHGTVYNAQPSTISLTQLYLAT